MDVLSDVLRAVRLTGAVYFDIHARAPWIAASPATSSICANVMPDFDHVIAFHIMMDGECWAQLDDESEPPVHLEAGDAILIPKGESHGMGSALGTRAKPDLGLYYRPKDKPLPFVFTEFGGSGEKARFVCPPEIAYGAGGTPDGTIPPGATLVFEVELIGIKGR